MFVYRNAEGVHGKRKVGIPWSRPTPAIYRSRNTIDALCFPINWPMPRAYVFSAASQLDE